MFKKILIANRGEIACRVIKTARKMGIATVAVYSDVDRDAPHVWHADEAVALGAWDGYLKHDLVIAAAQKTGAQAVHPGYGFLAENAAFARKLREAGITFIGPSPEAMNALGDKLRERLSALAAKHKAPMLVTGFGSIFGIHFHEGAARNIDDLDRGEAGRERAIADLKKLFHLDMIASGQYISRRIMGNLSLETSPQETDAFHRDKGRTVSPVHRDDGDTGTAEFLFLHVLHPLFFLDAHVEKKLQVFLPLAEQSGGHFPVAQVGHEKNPSLPADDGLQFFKAF